MLSHNNWEEQIKKYEPKKQRFTIKKLSVGVASVLLGVTFAAGTASADSTTANADSASGSDSAEQTDHNLTLNSTSTSTLKSATAASQSNSASAAVQNPAGDVKAQAANDYEAAVSAAVANASSDVASDAVQNSSASSVQSSSAADSSAQASAVKSTATQAFSVRSAAVNNFNYASVFASLAAMQQSNNDNAAAQADTNAADSEYSNYKTVTNAYELQNAISDYRISGVNVKGNINPFGDLNINRAFTIHGVDGAVLNLSQNKIVNNGQLTLVDVTVNGSVTGNGTVNIKGTVNSNVNDFNSVTFGSVNELKQQIGSTLSGASVNNWKAANIAASNVNIEQGATLNINRSITGDGIAEPDGGKINVDINASLNVNLKDAQTASRANEQSSSLDNASAGVRILDNGTFTSGDSAKINIHAGHGRAVVINEPFGGTGAVASNTILGEWENGRTGDRSTEAAKHRNTMILGDSTTMNITGRGGIVLGYTATFVTGDHSIIHIDNQGNGEGLLLDANSKVIVSPHSQLLMTSNGKNASGSYDGGNYIGMGQDAKFRVEHDAVFRYRLTNSMNNEKRPYADNFNIISQASNTHPEVYVGNNATFDGQSDYDDYYGEIFAFSLTSGANTSTVFQIDGAKYVNWEKNSQVIRHNGAGNLFYSMDAGLIDATGQKYYVFKWNNKNLNDNNYTFDDSSSESIAQSIANFKNSSDKYWTDIEHLATKYSKSGNTAEWPGHVVSGNDITAGSGYNPVDKKTGTPIGNYNTGDGDDAHTTGFDPLNSQRLVLVASIIPTQEDKTSQEVDNYDVKIVYDENLKPGQVQLVQKGVNGLKRTTTTTYYNVDPSTGEKTLDTSKGINGVSTTTTVLNQKQDEIIHIGKQTATINYLKQTGNSTATPITDENGKAIVGTVTGKPVQTDAQGNVKFDAAGNATANTIDYTNYESDLNNAEENASGYKYSANDDEWAQAVKDGTNKYNVSGLTKEAIQKAAENAGLNTVATITNEGPVFNVVLKKAVKENASLKIVDDTENGKTLNILNATGDENTAISFENGASTVQDYLNKGYKFVSVVSDANGNILSTTNYDAANFGNYDTDPNSDQSFTVHLVHTYAPVNPNNPHEGVNPDQYEKTVNETVHYKYSDGSKAADDNIQTSKWSRTLTLDNVTGKIVPNGEYDKDWSIEPGQPTEYKQVDSPVIKGYYADQANVPATKVTQDDIEKTVTYKPLGHIIPVDPTTDDPIPNAPQPQFPNDPNDPTKGNPGEKPTVPGYHPESGKPGDKVTPNPGNPGEDVKVPYVKDQGTVSVIFHDDTTDSTIPNVGFNSGDAAADTPVTYNPEKSISDLEKQGYVYVRTEGTLPDKVEANKNITVTVHMKHGVQPVTPTTPPTDVPKNTPKEAQPDQLTKKVNLTVNYVNADGTAFTGKVPANAKQTATFTGTAYVDKITGKLVNAKQEDGKWVINTDDTATPEITWTSDKTSFEGVTSPAEENYHVSNVSSHKDGDNVAAITGLTKDSGNIDVTVTYAKNGTTVINGKKVTPTQTVKFVDGEGNELAKAITTTGADFVYSGDTRDEVTGQITKTGSWDSTSHIFGTQDVPVIDGYVAVSGYTNQNGKFVAGGLTATLDDPNVVATVVYQKVGNIVPQLPDGTPVPNPDKPGENVPNKPYTNDPTNPTDVNPKEPVPNIPGYRPEVPTVTPEVPTKDTPVVYNQIQKADLTIVDQDNGNKQIVASGVTTKFAADGINGEAITFTGNEAAVKALENMGYVYVDSDFTSGTKFDGDGATDQHFTITMKHGHQPVNPNEPGKPGQPINPNDPEGPKYPQGSDQVTKNVTRTIQYVDENGNKVSDSVEQPVNFTAEGVLDKVTGQWVTPLTWSGSQTVNGVKSPVVEGYHLVSVDRDGEGNNVKGVTLTHENDSYTVTVKYAKNGKIIPVDPTGKPIPNVPTPQYPTDPTDPSKVTPNEPVPSIPGLTPEVPTVTPTDPGKNTPVKYSQTVNATVNYIDNVTGKTLKTDSLSGLEGVKSDYSTKSSIDGYEAQGYKLVKDGFPKDGYIFEVGGEHTFNVYLTHTTSPVTPDHPGAGYSATDLKKTVTRTINYLDGQGNVVAQQVAQSFDFIANGTVDNVTHKLVTVVDGKITGAGELTWNAANHDFDAVESPAVKGMHVTNVTPADQRDGNNVAKTTVNAQSGNIIVNVYYASNGTHQDGAKNLPSTQTVTFVDEAGNVLHVPSTLDFTFVRTPDVTDPEGNVTEGTWTTGTSHTYKTVNVPVIPGYVTDRTVAGGMTATIDNLDVADKVVYKKVGKIIPVDPTGKPIPGAPTPDYPNDPQNPTKVTPDEPVPSVPGYTPDVPTVTPGVPTVDTPVTYRQNVQATVTYIDDVTNTVLDSDSLSGLDGKKSDYSTAGKIANYESHGYALVSDDFPKDGYTFSVEGTHNFTVHLTHSTSPVNPDHPGAGYNKTDLQKDVTRTIYFVNTQDGKQVAEPVNQTVSFTANGTVDNVTGKLVTVTDGKITGPGELTWTSAQDVKGVQSPAVNGMHVTYVTRDADGTNVKGVSLTHNDSSYDVYVNYAPNGTTNEHGQNIPASQTIKFVDESGNTLRENNVQTSEFVRTPDVVDAFTGKTITEGSWNETSHKFDVIDVPVIEGYVATVKTAGGLTATTDNPNVVTEVVYKKVGKIIPVDPTGKPIPNVPTPEYPNDPTDPTKVTPNEPVPTIPGYTPETPTVTPEVPTKDTPVKYTPVDNTQNAQVRYIDLTNNEEIANSGNLSGQPGDKINYSTADTIKSLTDKGYVLVNDGFPADAAFDNDKGHDQVFTVTFRHGTQPVNPNEPGKPGQPINPNDPEGPKYPQGSDQVTKNVTRTVQYVDENGNKISDPVEQTVNFTAEGVLDKVTGQWVTPLTWSGSQSVAGVKTPVVEGYHVVNVDRDGDGVNVKGVTLTHENDNYTVTVQYAKNGKIVPVDPTGKPIPNVPTPQYPTDPENPAKVTPDEPVPSIPGFVPEVPTVTPTDPGKDTPVHYTPVVNDQNAVVNYVDQDNNNAQIATSGNLTGKPGSLIDYSTAATIKQLEDQGYVLVSNGFPAGAVFDNDDNTTQTYTVVLKHGTTTFKPDKPGTPGEPINPNYPEGPKVTNEDVDYSKDVKFTVHYVGAGSNNPADNVQNAQWTRAITVDNVTGKIISSTEWVSNKDSYSNVATPVVEGYHADRAQVDGQKVTMEDQEATVTYVPNGKIVPVDPTGKPIPNVPTPQYPTDPTDPTKVTPNEPVPTIPNYTPEVPTVTPTDPGVDTPVKYTPNTVNPKPAVDQIAVVNYVDQDNNNAQIATSGNLTGKAGSVINYSTADEIKQLEAHGYVLVTDGFPVGATFDDNADQNQVFTVVLKHGHAPVGPKNPEEPGTPVNPGYPEGPKWPAKDNYSKDYTSTVHFVDNNGNKMRDDNVQTSTWTRTLIIDKVTGQILNPDENWTSDKASYNEVKVPVINGYVADKANVPAKEAVQQNIEDTVTYTKVGNIVPVDPSGNRIPNVPVVPYTNDPTDPTKVIPNEPVPSVPGMTPNVTTVTPDHPTVDTPVVYTTPTPVTPQTPVTPEPETPAEPARPAETPAQPAAPEAPAAPKAATPAKATPAAKQEAKKLPQTGNENSSSAAALGLAALGLTGLLAAGKKRRKED